MDRSEITRKVKHLLSFGTGKSEVYSELSGPGVKDSHLAWAIASYPDPALYARHKNKVRMLAILLVVETVAMLAALADTSTVTGMDGVTIFAGLFALVPLLFAWRFCQPVGVTYSGYIVIALCYVALQLLLGFKLNMQSTIFGEATGLVVLRAYLPQFMPRPTGELIALGIAAAQIGFVWYVRSRLFPELGFFSAKKAQGRYVFSS